MFMVVTVPCVVSASRLASTSHSAVAAARMSSSMGRAAGQQKFLRARTPVACDAAFDNLGIDADEFGDEYEEALARYTALGLFDNLPEEEVEEVDDDATPEEMAALSQEYLAALAEERARQGASMQEQLAAAAEAEERQRIAQWEEHFVNTLRLEQSLEHAQATWDEDRTSKVEPYREPERGC